MSAARQLTLDGDVAPTPGRAPRVLSHEQTEALAAALVALVRGEITRLRFEEIRAEVVRTKR